MTNKELMVELEKINDLAFKIVHKPVVDQQKHARMIMDIVRQLSYHYKER